MPTLWAINHIIAKPYIVKGDIMKNIIQKLAYDKALLKVEEVLYERQQPEDAVKRSGFCAGWNAALEMVDAAISKIRKEE